MPNIKSAIKRVDVSERNRVSNKSNKNEMNTTIKNLDKAVKSGNKAEAEAKLKETFKVIDENVTKGTIHKNKANRKKAVAAKSVSEMK